MVYVFLYTASIFFTKSPHFYIPLYRIRHKKGAPLTKQQKHPFITHNLFGMGLTTTATHSCFRTWACRCYWTTYALHTFFLFFYYIHSCHSNDKQYNQSNGKICHIHTPFNQQTIRRLRNATTHIKNIVLQSSLICHKFKISFNLVIFSILTKLKSFMTKLKKVGLRPSI